MHLLQVQHLTQNYIQEKSTYLSISKRVVRIRLQSLHASPSFRLYLLYAISEYAFSLHVMLKFSSKKIIRGSVKLIS